MKRSNMILNIAECLIEPHFPDDVLKEANYILTKLEKLGMLPPKMIVVYNNSTVTPTDHLDYDYKREWESEK